MPYSLQNNCIINSATGATVKCHPSRIKARRHLAALMANVPEAKAVAEGSAAPGGRQPMTRAEAARHASLVRWKKEQPLAKPTTSPDIQARVKEILAEKAKKKGPKAAKPKGGKGKGGGAKPKDARTSQEKANQNRAAVAKQGGMGDLEGTLVRLNAGMQGAGMENDKHDALIKKGLAERGPDGKTRLSAAGKKWKRAADKGDAEGASAALAEGQQHAADRGAKEKAKSDKAAEREGKKQAAAKQKQAKVGSAKEKAKAKAQAAVARKQAQDKKKAASAQTAKDKAAERAAAPAKKQAENRAKVAKDMADQDAGLAPAGAAALSDFADGKPLKPDAADSFEKMGLTEKDDQGNHRLTAEGRAAAQAMNKGDTRAALDAISRAGEKKRKPTAGKAIDMYAIKAGARHSKTDQQHIQAIHDSAVACGADCGAEEGDDEDEGDMMAEKAIKGIMDDPGYYAQHECSDIMQASSALGNLAMLLMSELSEEDEDMTQVSSLCSAARTLVEFIDGELDELEEAAKADAEEDATIGHEPMKAITVREDVNPKAGVAEYGAVAFADAKNKKYPIDTEAHVRAAWNYLAQEKNAAKYSPDEVKQIKAKIVAAWKKLIDKAGPPSAEGKSLDESFFAVKALGDGDEVVGPAIRYGAADEPDLSEMRDYFTEATNFYLDAWDKRPMLWHHAVPQTDLLKEMRHAGASNDEIKAMREALVFLDQNPIIGTWTKAVADPMAVWMNGVLDRAHKYRAAIKRMIDLGLLKISTDSIPQLVRRERQLNGTHEVKCWPIVAASLTPQAAEPRLLDVSAIKSWYEAAGIELPFAIDDSQEAINPDPTRADGLEVGDDERARALLLELDLLELETQ